MKWHWPPFSGLSAAWKNVFCCAVAGIERLDSEQETLKSELKTKTAELKKTRAALRKKYAEAKKAVKLAMLQTRWLEFGITDKR